MARTQIRRSKQLRYHADRIAEMAARLVGITDQVLASEPHSRERDDARRMLRVTLRQLEMIAGSSRDPMLMAAIYDANERFRESCPTLFQ